MDQVLKLLQAPQHELGMQAWDYWACECSKLFEFLKVFSSLSKHRLLFLCCLWMINGTYCFEALSCRGVGRCPLWSLSCCSGTRSSCPSLPWQSYQPSCSQTQSPRYDTRSRSSPAEDGSPLIHLHSQGSRCWSVGAGAWQSYTLPALGYGPSGGHRCAWARWIWWAGMIWSLHSSSLWGYPS